MFRTRRIDTERPIRYATAANFFEIYNGEMHSLFLLSILLTADIEKAEQCFFNALEECLNGIDVFMEWARLWARRAIIKHAIKLITPVPEKPVHTSLTSIQSNLKLTNGNFIGAIFSLGTFERFVFVMSLLERHSDEDCSALLNCRRRDIESARGEAMKSLSDTSPWPGNIRELQNVIERSVIVCDTANFSVDESWLSRQPLAGEPKSQPELSRRLAIREKEMIEAALRESGGRVSGPSGAAAKLGIPGSALYWKIGSLGIDKNRFKTKGHPTDGTLDLRHEPRKHDCEIL
jgi:Bacterial regulatory protein, Fis family